MALGLPDSTLGVTWPSMRADLDRPLSSLGLLLGATTIGYLPASAASGRLILRFGTGRLLVGATTAYLITMALYVTAPRFALLVLGSLTGGIAAGIVDTGLNAHFALHHGPRAMNILHASFGVGATIGPLFATLVIDQGGS